MTLKFFNVNIFHNLHSRTAKAITISCETEDPDQKVEIHQLSEEDVFTITDNLSQFSYQRVGLRPKLYRTYYLIDQLFKVWFRSSKRR
jgi:hypothetical protein